MSKNPTRRAVIGAACAGAAAIAVPVAASEGERREAQFVRIDAGLAKPLSPEAMKLLEGSIKDVESASQNRLKTKLPENSEPCFTYIPLPRGVR